MLLSAGSRVTNTPKADGGSGPPTLIEPVVGKIRIRNLEKAAAVYSSPLDGAGRPMGEPTPARKTAAAWEVTLGEPVNTWYEMTVNRP
jgi:hypothetical protein